MTPARDHAKMGRKFNGLMATGLTLRERIVRFCNNPGCELCDVHLRPREVLMKGNREICPRCLEPLMVQRRRPLPPVLPFKPRAAGQARPGAAQ